MPEPMTDEEFINKIGWEGGVISALEYGLKASDLSNLDGELAKAWGELEKKWRKLQPKIDKVEALLPDEDW